MKLIVSLCLVVLTLAGVWSCEVPKTKVPPPPPLTKSNQAITVFMELTLNSIETIILKEQHDFTTGISLVEYPSENGPEFIYVDRNQNIVLSYAEDFCHYAKTNDSDKVKSFFKRIMGISAQKIFNLFDIPKKGPVGPLRIFQEFGTNYTTISNDSDVGVNDTCDNDRTIACNEYIRCTDMYTHIYHYSSTEFDIFDKSSDLAGVPLRYQLDTTANLEVLSIDYHDRSIPLNIPTGIGCQIDANGKEMPRLGNFEFKAEISYTGSDVDGIYVSSLDAMNTKLVNSLRYSYWRPNITDESKVIAGETRQDIFDKINKIVFPLSIGIDMDQPKSKRVIKKCDPVYHDEDHVYNIPLPHSKAMFADDLIFKPPGHNAILSYLGPNHIRGLDTTVFEAYFDEGNQKRYVTYHFTDYNNRQGTGTLAAILIRAISNTNNEHYEVQLHIVEYSDKPQKLYEKLNVETCYNSPDKDEFNWFQIEFVLEEGAKTIELAAYIHQIKENLVSKMCEKYNLNPMRMPEIMIDVLEETVEANILLVERVLAQEEFSPYTQKDIKAPAKVLGIMSNEDCMLRCLGMPKRLCTAVSTCGSLCSISNATNPDAKINIKDDEQCTLNVRMDTGSAMPVMAEVMRNIKEDLDGQTLDKMLRVIVMTGESSNQKKSITLRAVNFDDSLDFESAFHGKKKKSAVLETSFNIVNVKTKYTAKGNRVSLGSRNIDDCALACLNREDCETFSSCDTSQECIVSPDHVVYKDNVEEDFECLIYQSRYLNRFERFPGLTTGGNEAKKVDTDSEENCAYECINYKEKDNECKSFDFCAGDNSCLLYLKHITESEGAADKKPTCAHFSKDYLYDYGKKMKSSAKVPDQLAQYSDVSESICAKRCSEWEGKQPCLSFDFCAAAVDGTGNCRLTTVNGTGSINSSDKCDYFYYLGMKGTVTKHHGAGAAFGLSLLLISIGTAVGVLAMVGYRKYRGV